MLYFFREQLEKITDIPKKHKSEFDQWSKNLSEADLEKIHDAFNNGDGVKIVYDGREYESIFTGLKYKKNEAYITCLFGKTRINFTDRLKQYIEKNIGNFENGIAVTVSNMLQ